MNSEIINRIVVVVSTIGVVFGFTLLFFLVTKIKEYKKANRYLIFYFLIFVLRVSKSMFYSFLPNNSFMHHLFLSSLLAIGPLLFLYTMSVTKKQLQARKYYVHFLPLVVLLLFSKTPFFNAANYWSYAFLFLHGCIYGLFVVCIGYKNKQIAIKTRNWICVLGGITVFIFTNSLLILNEFVPFYPSSAIVFSLAMIVCVLFLLKNKEVLDEEKSKYAMSNLSHKTAKEYYVRLKETLEREQLYLDPELSLQKLSDLLSITPKQLSQTINQIEQKNYAQYIMYYRVKEAQKKLKDKKYEHYKISAIAFECGFSSISSFNSAFKKITKTTAAVYRNK